MQHPWLVSGVCFVAHVTPSSRHCRKVRQGWMDFLGVFEVEGMLELNLYIWRTKSKNSIFHISINLSNLRLRQCLSLQYAGETFLNKRTVCLTEGFVKLMFPFNNAQKLKRQNPPPPKNKTKQKNVKS